MCKCSADSAVHSWLVHGGCTAAFCPTATENEAHHHMPGATTSLRLTRILQRMHAYACLVRVCSNKHCTHMQSADCKMWPGVPHLMEASEFMLASAKARPSRAAVERMSSRRSSQICSLPCLQLPCRAGCLRTRALLQRVRPAVLARANAQIGRLGRHRPPAHDQHCCMIHCAEEFGPLRHTTTGQQSQQRPMLRVTLPLVVLPS